MSNQQHSFKKECWHLNWQMHHLFSYLYLSICLSVYALILDRIRSFRNLGGKFSILARKESRIWLGFFSTHLGLESKNEVDVTSAIRYVSTTGVCVCECVVCIRALIPEPNSALNRAGCRKASQGDIIHSSYNSRVSV